MKKAMITAMGMLLGLVVTHTAYCQEALFSSVRASEYDAQFTNNTFSTKTFAVATLSQDAVSGQMVWNEIGRVDIAPGASAYILPERACDGIRKRFQVRPIPPSEPPVGEEPRHEPPAMVDHTTPPDQCLSGLEVSETPSGRIRVIVDHR